MPKREIDRPWREYRLGIIVSSAILVVGLGIFVLGSTCGPLKPEVHLYHVDLDDAAGLRVGSIVRVAGMDAGEVTEITIVPPEGETQAPLAPGQALPSLESLEEEADVHVALAIREPFHERVTKSSRAQLAMLGAGAERYVKVTAGDPREPPLSEGSRIPAVASVDWDLVIGRLARAFNEIQEIVVLTDEIRAKLAAQRGTMGLLTQENAELYRQVDALTLEAYALMELIDHGPGFIGLYAQDLRLQAELDSLNLNLEAIGAAVRDPKGGFQSYAEPEELRAALAGLRGELTELDARLEGPGSLGRFLNDPEIYIEIRVLQTRIGEFIAGLKKNPLRHVNIKIF